MKKLLALMLAAALALSLVACGGGSGAGDTNTPSTGNGDTTSTDTSGGGGDSETSEPQGLAIGETAATDKIEFTLNNVLFSSSVVAYETDDYLLPVKDDYDGEVITAKDGNILISISCTIKNIGKVKTTGPSRPLPNGYSMSAISDIKALIDIDYNGGYIFTGSEYAPYGAIWTENGWNGYSTTIIEPLTDAKEYRCCFSVPKEVMENEDLSLNLVIYLPASDTGTDFSTIPFTYIVR